MALNPLDPLTAALQRKSQATAKLEGVNEDYSRATALRDQDLMGTYNPKLGNYGTGDMGTVLRGIESIMAGKEAKALKPQRTAARQEVAASENALPLWNAERQLAGEQAAADKFAYDKTQDTAKATALVEAARLKAKADAGAQRQPEAWVNADGTGLVTGFSTEAGFVDEKGQPLDLSNKVPYKEFSAGINTVGSGIGKTPAKLINDYKKTIRGVDNTYKAISDMTAEDKASFNDKSNQATNILIKSLSPSSFEALTEEALAGYSPATKRMLIQLNKLSADERNRLFGGALTKTELSSSRDFLPAVMGRGLDWIVSSLESGKRSSVDGLIDSGTGQRQWLLGEGLIDEDYAPAAQKIGYSPLTPVAPGAYDDPEEEAEYQAWKAAQANK